jgi:hypothetical protein
MWHSFSLLLPTVRDWSKYDIMDEVSSMVVAFTTDGIIVKALS